MRLVLAATLAAGPALAQTAHDEGDPWCDDLAMGEAGGVDCALPSGDEKLLYFTYEETGEPEVYALTVRQFDHEGELLAETETPLTVEYAVIGPELRDVTEDGIPELFVPVLSGMVNHTWSVWSADGSGIYVPAGTLEGTSVAGFEVVNGLVIGSTRDSAVARYETGSMVRPGGIEEVYSLYVDYAERTCTPVAIGNIGAVGLTEAALIEACEARDWE